MELVDTVIEKKLFAKRDTLVLPILYNARHALELALKFTDDRLTAAGVLPATQHRNHNIEAYWNKLSDVSLGDEKLSQIIQRLKPFVLSLSRIDDNGQELRYHLNKSNDPSLSDYSIANLKVIRESLSGLSEIITDLKYRTTDFCDERAAGSFTSKCSRRDLFEIAMMLPQRDLWNDPAFDVQKALVKARYNLSNSQFSKALDAIQSNREMNAIIGMESELLHLSDDKIVWIIEQWKRIHAAEHESDDRLDAGIVSGAELELIEDRDETCVEVFDEIAWRLTTDELAELEAIFYLGRDRWLLEYYERHCACEKAAGDRERPARRDRSSDGEN